MNKNNVSEELYNDIKYGTNIIPEEEYKGTLITIAEVASEMVEKTLGPYGKTTMLNDGVSTYPTKDGWSVLRALRFNDPIHNILFNVLRQVSFDTDLVVGDGTTTSFIGATLFMRKVLDYLKDNEVRQGDFLKCVDNIIKELSKKLLHSKYVRHIDPDGDFSDIFQIAKVSSNGDTKIAEFLKEIYHETKNPNIYIEISSNKQSSFEIQTGYKINCNPIKLKIFINSDNDTYIEDKPACVAIFNHSINYQEHKDIISGITNYINSLGMSCIIFAPHFDDVILNVLGTSMESLRQQNKIPNIMLAQIPLSMQIHKDYLDDLVLLTNAQIIDYGKVRAFNILKNGQMSSDEKIEDSLLQVPSYDFESPQEVISTCLGRTNKIIVGSDYALIQEYQSIVNKKVYDQTIKEVSDKFHKIKEKTEKDGNNHLTKEYMDIFQHYTKLTGNMGVIKVGGDSVLEKLCTKDSINDAVFSCKSAFENGYVRGLNLSTLNVIDEYLNTKDIIHSEIEEDIIKIIREVFFELSLKVLENKNPKNARMIIGKVLDNKAFSEYKIGTYLDNNGILNHAIDNEYGFDLIQNQFMKDKDCWIVNSVMTDITVLQGIRSIIVVLLTSNQFLSINRAYDRTMGEKQRKDTIINMEKDKWTAVAKSIVELLQDKNII